jgi:16S rRNA (guanine966-N2)-methyltransferase
VPNANVLDLFAGTGAYGIEALSRGGQSAVFIDYSRIAGSIISRNIKLCQLETRAQVIRWDITTGLNCLRSYNTLFNLVFMDPPYNSNLVAVSLKHLQALPILSPGSLIVVEHSLKEAISSDTMNIKLTDQRRYGKSLVSILECML